MQDRPSDLDLVASAIASVDLVGPQHVSDERLAGLLNDLHRVVSRRYPSLADQAWDVTSSAVERFLRAARTGRLADHPNPAAYLVVIAHNESRRLLSRSNRGTQIEEVPAVDDDLPRVDERLDAAAAVGSAIEAAWSAGDQTAAGVLQAYLDLASRSMSPSLRSVASDAHVTHPTVSAILRYTGTWLRAGGGAWDRLPNPRPRG